MEHCSLQSVWIFDSGCENHVTHRKEEFDLGTLRPYDGVLRGIGDAKVKVEGIGSVTRQCIGVDSSVTATLTDVLYAPGLGVNLISITQLLDRNASMTITADTWTIQRGEAKLTGRRFGNLFILQTNTLPTQALVSYAVTPEMRLWHNRMGHLGEQNTIRLKEMVTGMNTAQEYCTCEACVRGRMRELPHRGELRQAEYVGDVIHVDICGPFHITSHKKDRYWITLVDGYSRFSGSKAIQVRENAWEFVCEFILFLEGREPQRRRCRIIHLDGAKEFHSKEFKLWAAKRGSAVESSTTEQHQSNGVAESFNIVIRDKLLPTMIGGEIPREYWSEVLETVNYLRNRSPHSALDKTPFELVFGQQPNVSNIRTVGTVAWALVPQAQRKKLDEKGLRCILLGFVGNTVYRLLTPGGKVISCSNVHFETEKILLRRPEMTSVGTQTEETVNLKRHRKTSSVQSTIVVLPPNEAATKKAKVTGEVPGHPELRYPLRSRHALLSILALAASGETTAQDIEPQSFAEAKRSFFWDKWNNAMSEEIQALQENKTWSVVPATPDMNILRGKWVYKLKRGPDNQIVRYKARWVVRGFEQIPGVDYFETFASVVKPMTYKILFAIAAALDLEIEQMDVKTAFLYGSVDEDIYVEQPTGFEDGTGMICKLNKALYGLKQAPRVWYKTLTDFLSTLGFHPIASDCGVFTKNGIFIAIYVDDLLIVGKDKQEISAVKEALHGRFQMTDLGPCSYYLGIRIRRNRSAKTIYLDQQGYVQKILQQFDMIKCAESPTPMAEARLQKPAEDHVCDPKKRREYQSAVGSLMYLMLGTRPDIAYAVSVLSRYSSCPDEPHHQAVKRVFRYLQGTKDLCLEYKGELQPLRGYSDSDWAGDPDTRRSTSGYVFDIGSGKISWSSRRQATTALSSCEAEYMGQTNATKEAIWLQKLFSELQTDLRGEEDVDTVRDLAPAAVVILCDNQGAIALAKNPTNHKGSKHIETQHHFVREKVERGEVQLEYIPTDEMVADGLTKPLGKERFSRFRKALGLKKITDIETGSEAIPD